jgi:hypothetical protein
MNIIQYQCKKRELRQSIVGAVNSKLSTLRPVDHTWDRDLGVEDNSRGYTVRYSLLTFRSGNWALYVQDDRGRTELEVRHSNNRTDISGMLTAGGCIIYIYTTPNSHALEMVNQRLLPI